MSERDFIQRFMFEALDIRGALVRFDQGWQAMQQGRGYGAVATRLLGEVAVVTLLIGGQLKQPARLTVQVRGRGPVETLVVDCDQQLRLRGMASAPPDLADAPVPVLLGEGHLVMTLQTDEAETPYQSLVPLEGDSVASVFEHYLALSEQQPAALWLYADTDCATGLFLQKLPDADRRDADGWNRLCHLAATVTPDELKALAPDALLGRLFAEEAARDGIRVFAPAIPRHHCPRDEQKLRRLVLSLGREEVESILRERGEVHIHDDMCNHDYRFSALDIQLLFGEAPPAVH
jgi:molecular chaperone Hsp33